MEQVSICETKHLKEANRLV